MVLKADGLAAGKGVVIAQSRRGRRGASPAWPPVVIEEFLEGEEVSFIGLERRPRYRAACRPRKITSACSMATRAEHRRHGRVLRFRILTSAQTGEIMDRIILPAISQMATEGNRSPAFSTPA